MSLSFKDFDPAFHGAGTKPGLEIWCIENLQLVPVPKHLYGKFFSGSSYLLLNTVLLKKGTVHHDIHYWQGNDSTEVDLTLASDKALELDASLGSYTVQYKEIQGLESEKFLSYFKPCIIPVEGVFSSGLGHVDKDSYKISLLKCKGDHVVHVKEVPFSRTSLNHDDAFILDTASKIFLFCGCNSSVQERAKALEVVQYIKENKHGDICEIATVEDGKLVADPDAGEFWGFFGGYAPIPRESPSKLPELPNASSIALYWISTQGKLCANGADPLSKEMLCRDKCYILDCGFEIFVWMGKNTSITERKTSISAAELAELKISLCHLKPVIITYKPKMIVVHNYRFCEFLKSQGRTAGTHLTLLTEGLETIKFRTLFNDWPLRVEPRLYEEGREKVAAMFKQNGYEVKELPEEQCEPIIDCSGSLKVWLVDGKELSLVPVLGKTQLFRGDCYILHYTYSGSRREENLYYAWFGRKSLKEDRCDAISHLNTLASSIKGHAVLGQVTEDSEPFQFFFIFRILIVFEGGMCSRYKNFIAANSIIIESLNEGSSALFRVQGTGPNNMQAIQVDQVSRSLNSSYCYILRTGASTFTWIGNLSSTSDRGLLNQMLEAIDPTWQPISVREGCEPDAFWNALGSMAEYSREKLCRGSLEDPNLFTCTPCEGDIKVKEIFNFTQDDLTTEDVLILHCHSEVYVWVGCNSHAKSAEEALRIGQKFLEKDVMNEDLSPEIPLYVVKEGQEPPFFTRFFEWDFSRANLHGSSFERKLAILKGKTAAQKRDAPVRSMYSRENSWGGGSGRHIAAGDRLDSNKFERRDTVSGAGNMGSAGNSVVLPYEKLKVGGAGAGAGAGAGEDDSVQDMIDITKREAYMSREEFEEKMGMTKEAFYELPPWRQKNLKISLHLF